MQIRVYYEDTDAGGIVYHANYLKFCERARSEMFFSKGSSPQQGDNHFVISKMDAVFKASAKLGDVLEVKSEVNSIKRSSFVINQKIFRGETLLYEMNGTYVLTNGGGKIVRLNPDHLSQFS